MLFFSILCLLVFSFPSFLLQCLPFYTTAWDVKALLAFETSWGQSRTKPETEELCDCGRVQKEITKDNTHRLSPSCIWTPQCPEKVPCVKHASFKYLHPNSQETFTSSRTNRCLDRVYLWGSSGCFQRHSCNHVWQFATRVCPQAQPQLCPETSNTHSLPPTGRKHTQ